MIQITQNFNLEEFSCPCCGFNVINYFLVHRLQVVRDIIGIPMHVLSGCRCQKHNNEVGGKPESQHLLGNACDWTIEDYSMNHSSLLLHEWSGGFHFYPGDNFIHTDVGLKRRW